MFEKQHFCKEGAWWYARFLQALCWGARIEEEENLRENRQDWPKELSTEKLGYPKAQKVLDRSFGCWKFPPSKYMCRLENDDLVMLCMLHGRAPKCWLLLTSFHWNSIESFQSRLICVWRIFHAVTGTQPNNSSSNYNSLSFVCTALFSWVEKLLSKNVSKVEGK